jgi:hypothetical protein
MYSLIGKMISYTDYFGLRLEFNSVRELAVYINHRFAPKIYQNHYWPLGYSGYYQIGEIDSLFRYQTFGDIMDVLIHFRAIGYQL